MEDFRVDFVTGSGAFAKTINLPLLPFTLIGSTTRVGMLSAPLRERFGLSYHLDYYSIEELSKVITRSSGILGLEIDKFSAEEIAKRSRGTPRIAIRLLKRIIDFSIVNEEDKKNPYADEELKDMLSEKGINISRRTIAKYRKMLKIPSSFKRRIK